MSFRTPILVALGLILLTPIAHAAPKAKTLSPKSRITLQRPMRAQNVRALGAAKVVLPKEATEAVKPERRLEKELRPVQLPEVTPPPAPAEDAGCRDPQAADITVTGISRNADGTWQFSLRGTVRNGGDASFESRPNQQGATLYEGSDRRAVAHFTNLAPGQRVNTPFTRITRWYTGQEFHGGFKLRVDYDPDIFIDGNPRNDDCQLGNNERVLRAGEIDALLLRSGR